MKQRYFKTSGCSPQNQFDEIERLSNFIETLTLVSQFGEDMSNSQKNRDEDRPERASQQLIPRKKNLIIKNPNTVERIRCCERGTGRQTQLD